MSKKTATYAAPDFLLPKVQGLAVHNAKKATDVATEEYKESPTRGLSVPPPEVQAYCLFGVNPDCSVFPLASAATSADMAPITKVANLRALVAKYKLIGFVLSRVPKNRREYDVIQAPKEGGAK